MRFWALIAVSLLASTAGCGRNDRPESPDPEAPFALDPAARLALIRRRWPGNIRELVNTLDVAVALADGGVITTGDLPEPAMPEPAAGATGDLPALLEACNGNVSEAARRLGVDRTTIHRRLRRLGRG